MALISSNNTSFAYDGRIILKDINFNIENGDYLCILGENGAGKSTLIKGILKIKKPFSGSFVFNDLSSNDIGYLPQQIKNKDFPASVMEVISSGYMNKIKFRPFLNKKEKDTIYKNMEILGITNLKNRAFSELSGGQQQKVFLARALTATTKLILLDEPTTALDPIATNDFYSLISDINKNMGITIIMVSHDIEAAINYSSKILHIQCEQLFFGKTDDYLNTEFYKKFT